MTAESGVTTRCFPVSVASQIFRLESNTHLASGCDGEFFNKSMQLDCSRTFLGSSPNKRKKSVLDVCENL